jgi:dihydrolipoamide dehydrogenase
MSLYDLVVIGAGPGGYVAAIRAAQLGLKVACIEKEPALGGTCLRVGCIPSKALLESSEKYDEVKSHLSAHGISTSDVQFDLAKMMQRKDRIVKTLTGGVAYLFKKNGITRYEGTGSIVSPTQVKVSGVKEEILETKNILIASGSKVATLPGIEWDHDLIGGSTEALTYPSVPNHLIVIGAGVIGLELGSVWLRLGAKVTVLEYADRIMNGMDDDLSAEALKIFTKQGMQFKLGVKVTGAKVVQNADGSKHCEVSIDGQASVSADRVLVAVGRRPNTDGLNLEAVGITPDRRGIIPTNAHFQTSVPNIFAIGDVIAGPMLAHKAEEEGVACAEWIATGHCHVNYDAIPGVVYTHPEIASVGKTEAQLQKENIPYKKGNFGYKANGRAMALEAKEGFVKVLAHQETDRILGVHMIGVHAGDLIAEAGLAMEFSASAEDLGRTCHAHPTLSEILKEAALATDNRAINQ